MDSLSHILYSFSPFLFISKFEGWNLHNSLFTVFHPLFMTFIRYCINRKGIYFCADNEAWLPCDSSWLVSGYYLVYTPIYFVGQITPWEDSNWGVNIIYRGTTCHYYLIWDFTTLTNTSLTCKYANMLNSIIGKKLGEFLIGKSKNNRNKLIVHSLPHSQVPIC